MFMRTERLFLRPVFPEDWHDIMAGIADFRVVSMLENAPWRYGEEQARAYCMSLPEDGEIRLSVTLPEKHGAPVVGQIGMRPNSNGRYELGYWIARRWQKRGFAVEAAHGILAIAQGLGISELEAGHYLDNSASSKVLRRCGFQPTGEIAPTYCIARGGEVMMMRRYAIHLAGAKDDNRPVAA